MTAMLFLSVVIPLLAGLALTVLYFPLRRLDAATGLFHISLGTGIGLGVLSCLYFLAMLPSNAGALCWLDPALAVLLIVLAVFLIRKGWLRPKGLPQAEENAASRRLWVFPVLLAGTVLSGLASVAIAFLREPHGKWDAWVIWNLHARFILRGGGQWQHYLASGLDWTHPDYPLLVPLSVVRMWKYAGSETLYGPIFLSILFMLAVAGLLVGSLAILRSRSQGCLAGLVLMGSPFFLDMAAFQFADIPLSFFLLATLVVFFLHDRFPDRGDHPLMLAGLTAALAAWTKNEGLLFLLMVLPVHSVWILHRAGWKETLRQAGWFCAGALPVCAVILVFKLWLAPSSDLFAGQTLSQWVDKLTDLPRYGQIGLAYLQTALTFTQGIVNLRTGFQWNPGAAGIVLLGVYLLLQGIDLQARDRAALRTGMTTVLLMLAGYFGVYLITPHDLHWHILTSLNRLFLQLWPAIILLCFMATRTPEQALARTSVTAVDRPSAAAQASREGRKKQAGRKNHRRISLS